MCLSVYRNMSSTVQNMYSYFFKAFSPNCFAKVIRVRQKPPPKCINFTLYIRENDKSEEAFWRQNKESINYCVKRVIKKALSAHTQTPNRS